MSALKDTTHECPKNGCELRVPHRQFACRTHWYELSLGIRRLLIATWKAGEREAHREAMADAIEELNA